MGVNRNYRKDCLTGERQRPNLLRMTLLQHALDWAARGVAVFPCQLPKKDPLTKNGFKDGSTDPDVIRRWWSRWPNAIIGAEVPKGIVIIDVDVKGGLDKKSGMPVINGADTWAALIAAHGEPHTFTVRTGGGGLHLWFKTTGWTHETNARGLFKDRGVDVRGHTTGYVILPPSGHELGTFYEVIDDREPIEMPDWIRTIITTEPKDTPPRPKPRDPGAPQGEVARAVERWNSDHPIAFERATRHRCPVCDDKGSFGPLKGDTSRWSCFSTDHPDDVGLQSNECFTGDALDLACYERSLGRVELLRQDGYLEDRPMPRRDVPLPPPPERIAEPDVDYNPEVPPVQAPDVPDEPKKKKRKKRDERHPATPRDHQLTAFVLPKSGYAVLTGEPHEARWIVGDRAWMRARMVKEGLDVNDTVRAIDSLPPCGGFLFLPPSTQPLVTYHGLSHLNLYRGINTPTDMGTPDDFPAIMALLDHLFDRGSPEFDDFLDWLAMPLQELAGGRPGWRTHVSPLLKGIPGAGKGFLGEVIAELYGEHFLKITQEQLEEDFAPAGLASALMVMIDELESPKKWNKFKGWVTEDTIQIRDMRTQSVATRIYFNLFVTSNLEKPVPVPEDDRRVYPFACPNRLTEDVIRNLQRAKNTGWHEVRAFHRFLLNRPLELRRMKPRLNQARAELVDANRDVYSEFVDELFSHGARSLVAQYAADMWPRQDAPEWHREADIEHKDGMAFTTVSITAMTRLLRAYAADRHNLKNASPKVLWPALERRGAKRVDNRRFGPDSAKGVAHIPFAKTELLREPKHDSFLRN